MFFCGCHFIPIIFDIIRRVFRTLKTSNRVSHITLYLRGLAGFGIRLCYSIYLFEILPVPVKYEFYLAINLWKFGQIVGIGLQWGPNIAKYSTRMITCTRKNLHQRFILGILQRDFRKYRLRKTLESVAKFLSSIFIPKTMHLSCSIGSLILRQNVCKLN